MKENKLCNENLLRQMKQSKMRKQPHFYENILHKSNYD